MKKAIKVLAAAAAVWGLTAVGVAQAAPSGTSHQHGTHAVSMRAMDTGWGPV